jgi:hypothetical protein
MLDRFGVKHSSSLLEVDASELAMGRGRFFAEGICKGPGSEELRLDTK